MAKSLKTHLLSSSTVAANRVNPEPIARRGDPQSRPCKWNPAAKKTGHGAPPAAATHSVSQAPLSGSHKAVNLSEGEGGFTTHSPMLEVGVQFDVSMIRAIGGAVILTDNGRVSIPQVQSAIDQASGELRRFLESGSLDARDLMEHLHPVVNNLCIMGGRAKAFIAPEFEATYYALAGHYWTIGNQIDNIAGAFFNSPERDGRFPSGLVEFLLSSIDHHRFDVDQETTD